MLLDLVVSVVGPDDRDALPWYWFVSMYPGSSRFTVNLVLYGQAIVPSVLELADSPMARDRSKVYEVLERCFGSIDFD